MSDEIAPLPRAFRMERALRAALHPVALTLSDESARHAGHAGAREGGQTHYAVMIVSDVFSGLNRIARTRMVNEVLAEEFNSGLHALTLQLRSPDERLS